jgi:methyl-accepting chemotaxis protein
MLHLKLRIGAKLAISAALGIAVMAGLGVYDTVDRNARKQLADEARAGQTVQMAAADASLAIHRLVIVNRDIRLATSPALVDQARKQAVVYATEGRDALDRALKVATGTEREQLATAQQLLAQYSAAISESADAQQKINNLHQSLGEEAGKWVASVSAVMALPALKSEPYRNEIILALERANALTAGARAAIATYFMHPGGDAKTQIKTALDTAYKAIKEASANVGDDGVSDRIEALQKFVPRYQAAFDNALAAIADQETVLRERADRARADLHKILDDTAKALSQRAAEREAAVADHESRSQTISRLGELAVALVLIVSALFARFNVAHPIRRIGDVLLQLANGNKSVEIPYAHRTDEIGETARAATAFKDNIAHMERLEAEQKQTEAQARAGRDAQARRRLRSGNRHDRQQRLLGIESAGNRRRDPDPDRRHDPGAGRHRGRRVGRGLLQCADGRCRRR